MAFIQLMHTLKAASNDGDVKSCHVRPDDLDIYYEPEDVLHDSQAVSVLQPPQVILAYVSAVRKRVWKFKDATLNTYDKAGNALSSVKNGAVDVYEAAKTNPLSMLHPACIAAAAITGAVVHGRGRKPVLRLTTATVAGTLVAGVAYPDRAVKTAEQIYYKGKEASISLVDLMKNWAEERKQVDVKRTEKDDVNANDSDDGLQMKGGEMVEESFVVLNANGEEVCPVDAVELASRPGVEPEQHLANISNIIGENSTVSALDGNEKTSNRGEHKIIQGQKGNSNNASSVESMVDYGQSSPEDNDMYSTRS